VLLMQVDAAEAEGKSVVLVNPVLKDLPSHSGIMGVRCALLLGDFRVSLHTRDAAHLQTVCRLCDGLSLPKHVFGSRKASAAC